jgi:hypothetical protein
MQFPKGRMRKNVSEESRILNALYEELLKHKHYMHANIMCENTADFNAFPSSSSVILEVLIHLQYDNR